MLSNWYKENRSDRIWWAEQGEMINGLWMPDDGVFIFSFDRKKIYNLFRDYPDALTKEEKIIFDRENPYWADFFNKKL